MDCGHWTRTFGTYFLVSMMRNIFCNVIPKLVLHLGLLVAILEEVQCVYQKWMKFPLQELPQDPFEGSFAMMLWYLRIIDWFSVSLRFHNGRFGGRCAIAYDYTKYFYLFFCNVVFGYHHNIIILLHDGFVDGANSSSMRSSNDEVLFWTAELPSFNVCHSNEAPSHPYCKESIWL